MKKGYNLPEIRDPAAGQLLVLWGPMKSIKLNFFP